MFYINKRCGLEQVKIVMFCSVTVTFDSQKTFANIYLLLPHHVTLVILTTSELLSDCFNHATYAEMVLNLVS